MPDFTCSSRKRHSLFPQAVAKYSHKYLSEFSRTSNYQSACKHTPKGTPPKYTSKLENTGGARLGGRGGRAGPKTSDLAQSQDSFPPSNPNVPVSMASQTQSNS